MQTDLFIKTKFEIYLAQNPGVYPMFKKFAFQLLEAGHKRIGSKMIFEKIRYETMLEQKGEFKINNSYSADMARKFESDYPIYKGVFEKRIMTKKDVGFIN